MRGRARGPGCTQAAPFPQERGAWGCRAGGQPVSPTRPVAAPVTPPLSAATIHGADLGRGHPSPGPWAGSGCLLWGWALVQIGTFWNNRAGLQRGLLAERSPHGSSGEEGDGEGPPGRLGVRAGRGAPWPRVGRHTLHPQVTGVPVTHVNSAERWEEGRVPEHPCVRGRGAGGPVPRDQTGRVPRGLSSPESTTSAVQRLGLEGGSGRRPKSLRVPHAAGGSGLCLPPCPVKGVQGFRVLSTDYSYGVLGLHLGRAGRTSTTLLFFSECPGARPWQPGTRVWGQTPGQGPARGRFSCEVPAGWGRGRVLSWLAGHRLVTGPRTAGTAPASSAVSTSASPLGLVTC